MSEEIEALAAAIRQSDHTVALTGAGISTASGIPDFRSDGGIWDQYDPAEFQYSRFKSDPAGFWELRSEMHNDVYGDADIQPNAAHEALATLEEAGYLDTLITQNIDGLHGDAGSNEMIEIHGNAARVVCESCGQRAPMDTALATVENGELPPRCESCDGVLKPDVVLFGEQLPRAALQRAQRAAESAAVFLAIGSSLSVQPAASLPSTAQRNGGTVAVINLDETPVSSVATYDIRADVTTALPELVEAIQ